MLSLLNSSLVPWLFAASIPIVIHLLTRRARRRIDLPTVRFLERTLAHQSRLWRWRDLLILLLRTLAVFAVVLAFTRPAWLSSFGGRRDVPAGVVVILDVSASMAYDSGGVSTFARAKGQVLAALSGLKEGDKANVVLCGAQPTPVVAEPTIDVALLKSAVRSAQPTEERADAAGAVGAAVEQLGKTNAKDHSLYIVSDFQRTNWSEVKLEAVPAVTRVLFVTVDSGNRENLGLTGLRARPAMPRVGEPVTIQAEVFNSSPTARACAVDLQMSDGRRFAASTTVGPYSSGNVSFPVAFDRAERVEVTAELPRDGLPADDVRRLVIDLQQQATVVVITDEDRDAPTTAAFYLSRVLNPDPGSNSGFKVVVVPPRALNNPTLRSADVAVVSSAPSMPGVQFEALARYVESGGNLVWLLYGDATARGLDELAKHLPAAEPMPLTVEAVVDLQGRAKGYVTLAEARYESRLLKAFRDPAEAGLDRIRFRRFCITSEVDPRAELLLKFEDGTPAAVRTNEGRGNLLLLNMSPAPSWSDLARQKVFLPLMHEFLKGILLKDSGQRESYAGTPAAVSISKIPSSVACVNPAGEETPSSLDKATGSVIIDRMGACGFYRLYAGPEPLASIAVNTHPDESDLRSIDPRELESTRQRQLSYLEGVGSEPDVRSLIKGKPVWPYLLVLALCFLFAEQWLGRMRPRTPSRMGGPAA